MATAVITNPPTILSLMENNTGLVGDSFTSDADIKIQGTNSQACTLTPSAGQSQSVGLTGTWNFTTAVHLRLSQLNFITPYLQTEANNGIQIYMSDGTNIDYWTVAGSDTYQGGWKQFLIYTATTPTEDNGANHAAITEIGFRYSVITRPRNAVNVYLDAWYYGDGYTVTGGTSGDEIDWSHIAALDLIEAYGVIEKLEDIYFNTGHVTVGAGATTTFFKSGQKIQFKDLPVNTTLYALTFEGSACNVDITGGAWGAAGVQDYVIDASDATINSFTLSGVQFENTGAVTFSSVTDIQNSTFSNCAQIDPSTGTFKHIGISNYVGTPGALLWPSDSTNISDLTFAICDNDIEYGTGSDATPSFFNILHDDNAGDYDVNNTSGASISIPLTGTSNGNSYNPAGNIVTFVASVTLTFTVKDSAGVGIQFARINIVNSSTFVELYQIETNISGIATQAHTYAGDVGIEGWVRQFDNVGDDYIPKDFSGTIKSTGFDANIILLKY